MNVLITNDDGVESKALKALAEFLSEFGTVYCVAPFGEQSGVSQAFTFRKPMQVDVVEGWPCKTWAVHGTPADCVKIGLNELIDSPVDFVISGVNIGLNLGVAVLYSGTVAAARESVLWDVPSIALSAESIEPNQMEIVFDWLEPVLKNKVWTHFEKRSFWNVNFTNIPPKGTKVCSMGQSMYSDRYLTLKDGYQLEGDKNPLAFERNSDDFWHQEGYTCVVPLQVDQTQPETATLWTDLEKTWSKPFVRKTNV